MCFSSFWSWLIYTRSLKVVSPMVQHAMEYIDQTPDTDTKVELITTLNNVMAGKIYVEIEMSRLIKKLAKIKEGQGLIAEAADLMQEVAASYFYDTSLHLKDFMSTSGKVKGGQVNKCVEIVGLEFYCSMRRGDQCSTSTEGPAENKLWSNDGFEDTIIDSILTPFDVTLSNGTCPDLLILVIGCASRRSWYAGSFV